MGCWYDPGGRLPANREGAFTKIAVDAFGMQLLVASAEDVVLAKLEWAKISL